MATFSRQTTIKINLKINAQGGTGGMFDPYFYYTVPANCFLKCTIFSGSMTSAVIDSVSFSQMGTINFSLGPGAVISLQDGASICGTLFQNSP